MYKIIVSIGYRIQYTHGTKCKHMYINLPMQCGKCVIKSTIMNTYMSSWSSFTRLTIH